MVTLRNRLRASVKKQQDWQRRLQDEAAAAREAAEATRQVEAERPAPTEEQPQSERTGSAES